MDVVELRVGGELKIMHESQNGSQMRANELVQKETKSSSFTQQDDDVFQVVERAFTEASRQVVLDSGSAVVSDFAARNMFEIHVKVAGDADHYSSLAARKLSRSEEASVDVHSEDSAKAVSIVEHAVLQKQSEEMLQAVESKPSLVRKWSREVSVDVIIRDGWPEAEAEVSVAEAEVSKSSIESEERSPAGRADSYPAMELEAPSTAGVFESLDIQVGDAPQDENIDLRPCPGPLAGGEADEPMFWEPTQVETINVAESFLCTFDVDEDSNIQHVKSTERSLSFADWESVVEADAGAMAEESTSAPPNSQSEQPQRIWSLKNLKERPSVVPRRAISEQAVRALKPKAPTVVGLPWPPAPLTSADDATSDTELLESLSEASVEEEHYQSLWSLQYLKTRPAAVELRRVATAQQTSSPKTVKLKAHKVVGLSWPPAPLTTEESRSAPPNGQLEQPHRIWSLENLKKRPLVEPRSTVSEQAVRAFKPKAPTVVGLPWPPTPVTSADDATDTELLESAISPSEASVEEQHLQRSKKRPFVEPISAVSEEAVRAVKPKAPTVVGLSWPPSLLISADDATDTELLESASSPSEANVEEQHVQMLRSLKNMKEGPSVEPRTGVSEQAVRPLKPKAPTVVGLSWPPTPLISADDKLRVGTAESTDRELLESASSPSEASIKEQYLQGLWSLQYLDTRPGTVEPRSFTAAQQSYSLKTVKLKAHKVVGLSWPPALFTSTAPGVFT